jgi:cytochrome c oxidase subunit 2
MAQLGEQQFQQLGCQTCHKSEPGGRGPDLADVFGKSAELASGELVNVDETYVRESILTPAAKVLKGYQPIMPAFQGQVSEETLTQLVEYVKSLSAAKK